VSFFEQIKPSLKTKWLDYYDNNQEWFRLLMDGGDYVDTPDGGRRPAATLILGSMSALEPRLAEILYHFFLVHANFDTVVEVVGLNFDPDLEMKNVARESAAGKPIMISSKVAEPSH
jgi:hypothetical protein